MLAGVWFLLFLKAIEHFCNEAIAELVCVKPA